MGATRLPRSATPVALQALSPQPPFRREKQIPSKRSRKPAVGALKPGPEPCAPETVQMVRRRLSYAGRPRHAERHGRRARSRSAAVSPTADSRAGPIANSSQGAFIRPTGAVETVSRTICPDLVRTVQRPVLRTWIAHFRHRLYKIGFSRREGGRGDEIARHRRSYEREALIFDPRHYLALLERKTGAFDQAAPLAGWALPEAFLGLRRRLEARLGKAGTREYVQVLRLLEDFRLDHVSGAVGDALGAGGQGHGLETGPLYGWVRQESDFYDDFHECW